MGRLVQVARGVYFEEDLPVGAADVEAIFTANGPLVAALPGYEPRTGQLQLVRAVASALQNERHLVGEAPCGTGKSLAYLVPAILDYARRRNDTPGDEALPVTVVTASINLQEQLVGKDLPLLQQVLPVEFTFGLLKGRNNYVCPAMVADEAWQTAGLDHRDQERAAALANWAQTTTTGNRSDLDFDPSPALWARFSMSFEDCPARDCAHFSRCFAFRAQEQARQCSVLVTNYHVLLFDIYMRSTGGTPVLPSGPLILDEAHVLAGIARDLLGGQLSLGATYAALAAAQRGLGDLPHIDRLRDTAQAVFRRVAALHAAGKGTPRLRTPGQLHAGTLVEGLSSLAATCTQRLDESEQGSKGLRAALRSAARRCTNVGRILGLADELPDNHAVSLVPPVRAHTLPTIAVQVIDVAPILQKHLWQERPTVVATSATLATSSGFDYFIHEVGVTTGTTDQCQAATPFNLREQALLVIPEGVPPDPNSDAFRSALPDITRQVVLLAQGRVLGLFTSWRNLEIAAAAVEDLPYRLLKQGDAPRLALIEEFKRDTTSVLFGTTSFWTGVDVPGDALSCVLIDKLPFPRQDDPVMDARAACEPRWFMKYSLPAAVIAFKQGFGRLIRTVTDRGVVVVLDQRLVLKPYGGLFTASLPRIRCSTRLEDLTAFLTQGGADADAA